MKTIFIFIFLFLVIVLPSCRNCNYSYPDYTIDPGTKSLFAKSGSYFVYHDSIDHIIDSQYVNSYKYTIGAVGVGDLFDGCGATADELKIIQLSYRNGLFYDSIYLAASISTFNSPLGSSISYYEGSQISQAGFVYSSDLYIPNSLTVGGTLYPTVYKGYQQRIIHNSDTIPTDFYFAPNFGIIKRVEHRSTGDVSWDLIRYHIVQ